MRWDGQTWGRWGRIGAWGLCLLAAACSADSKSANRAESTPAAVRVEVRRLTVTSIDRKEHRTARAEPRREVRLAFGVPGRVMRVLADEGAKVTRGTLLATIDTRALRAQVEQAKVRVGHTERELARAKGLRAKNAVAAQRVDGLESEVAGAKAALEAAAAQLDQARIVAPFAADVVMRGAEPGAWANPGVPMLQLAQLDPIRVVAQVPDHVRPRIAAGATAEVTARGLEAPRSGEVVLVSPMVDPRSGLFRVEIDVPNPDRRLAAGQPVEVTISAGALAEVYVLEPEWVVFRHDGPAVVVVDEGKARTVRLGPQAERVDGRFVVPRAALPDLPLVVKGQSMVREGRAVVVEGGAGQPVAEGNK